MACFKGSSGNLCLFFANIVTLWLVIQTSVTKGFLQDQYIGCFYDISHSNADLPNDNALTIESCIAKCQTTYATIQNGNACRCREDYGSQLPDTTCNLTCSGNNYELCGGVIGQLNAYVVYTVCPVGTYGATCDQGCHCKRDVPCDRKTGNCPDGCHGEWSGSACNITTVSRQYIGCYGDVRSLRAMEECVFCDAKGYSDNMSLGYCFQLCSARNYSYAGTQYSYECFCGESYTRYGPVNETSCSKTCTGNRNEICGGDNALSVYAVCPVGYYGKSCVGRCHCYNDERCIYRNGSCPSSRCKEGWTGTSCSIRECSTNNGDCYINETCSNVALKFSNVPLCRCSNGFRRNKIWEICTDIDECQQNTDDCDQSSTICSNALGSYTCMLKDEFAKYNMTSCRGEDVNSKTIVAGVVGFIIGVAVTVATAAIVLLVYRRRNCHSRSCQDNELKPAAFANEVKPYSEVHESGRTTGSDSKSNVENLSQNQQALDAYTSLKANDSEDSIYTSLE